MIEHQTFKHFGFGGRFNNVTVNLEIDDDNLFWNLNSVYGGIYVYAIGYF